MAVAAALSAIGAVPSRPIPSVLIPAQPTERQPAPRLAEEKTNTVMLDVTYDLPYYEELSGLYAMESTGKDTQMYYGWSEEEDAHIYQFDVPDGTYDFIVYVTLGNFEGKAMLTLDNVEVSSDIDLTLSTSSATVRTNIAHTSPSGEPIHLIYGRDDGIVPSAQLIDVMMHRDKVMQLGGLATDTESLTFMLCNNPESAYSLTRLDLLASPWGALNYVIPVDFTQEVCTSSGANWMSASESFATTPANITYSEYEASVGQSDAYYTFIPSILGFNGTELAFTGVGVFDAACPSTTVAVWIPEGYDGPFEMMPICTGSVIVGNDSSISGLPLRRTPEGLRQMGVNYVAFRSCFMHYPDSPVLGNWDAFSMAPPEVELGNCAPMLMIVPDEEYFDFTFSGRHGEGISIDSHSYSLPSVEYWNNIFGGQLSELRFSLGDETLCDYRVDFPYDCEWGEGGEYTLEINTFNVNVDGVIPGSTKTVSTFNTEAGALVPPTLTSLRILDNEGKINDRPASKTGATVAFTGGSFTYADNWVDRYSYLEFSPVECVAVEYSPYGADDFQSLPFAEEGEPVLPGYGNLFVAQLSGVETQSASGWYDLRISISDAFGGTQTQTLSPAFHLQDMSGICAPAVSPVSEEEEIFSLSGMRIKSLSSAPAGIYIVRSNGSARKVTVK